MAKTEVAVRKNTLPANLEKQMREDAAKGAKREANVGIGQFMSIRGGILAFQGTPVPGNKMNAVVLAAILENAWYEEEFDEKNPVPPDCYAFGDPKLDPEEQEKMMAPHEQAEHKQNEVCTGCEKNKFGSAEKGRGKACKNMRRLAVMHADALKGNIERDAAGQVAFLKVPPTSLPGWAQYVKSLDSLQGRPHYGVITEIAVVPDVKTVYKVTFSFVKRIDDKKALGAIYLKSKEYETQLGFPYQAIDASAIQKKGSAKKKSRRQNIQAQPPAPQQQRRPSARKF